MEKNNNKFLQLLFSPKYFPPIITLLILLIASLSITSLMTDQQLLIEKEQVIARIEPSTNAEAVATLQKGTEYDVLSKDKGWYKIRLDSRTSGWVPEWLLLNEELANDQALAAQILINTPVYTEMNEDSTIITSIEPDKYLIVRFESAGWAQVEVDGQYGFVKTRAVNLIAQANIPSIDLDNLNEYYDPIAIQQAKEAAEKIVVVRYSGEPLFDAPSVNATRIYDIAYGQKFKYIDEYASTDDPNVTFMLVEDSEGLQGYIESRISGMESDSIGHVTNKKINSIQNAIIMLDPGHGGEDGGATSADELTNEKDVTLATAMKIKEKLEAVGATVVMTRNSDEFIDLIPRSDLSNQQQVDAFISIHYDEGDYSDWSGTTTYYFHENDYDLAKRINDAISTLSLPNNGTLFGNYSVLRENTRQSVLLELGYMSNLKDLSYIRSDEYHEALANVITTALVEYFEN